MKGTLPALFLLTCLAVPPTTARNALLRDTRGHETLVQESVGQGGASQGAPDRDTVAEGSSPPSAGPHDAPVQSAPPPFKGRFFWGGTIGLSFGDVDYVELSPMLGYRFTPRFSAGAQLTYRYSNFSYYGEDQSTNDWGGDLFSYYTIWSNLFAAAEYEYLRYEWYPYPGYSVSDSYSSFLVGGGYAQPMGGNASFLFSALYNLSYSDSEPSPYGSPWVVRAGIGVGF